MIIFLLLVIGILFSFHEFDVIYNSGITKTKQVNVSNYFKNESDTIFEIMSNPQSNNIQTLSQNIGLDQGGREILRNSDISNDFVIDSANNIITIGTINDEDGSRTAYISKIDSLGELIWNKTIDGVNEATQVALGQNNNLFFIGNVQDGTSFAVSPNAINTTTNGFDDNILIQFNPDGDILWSTYWGGTDSDTATGIAIDDDENIIISGETQSANFPVTVGAVDQIKETDRFSSEFYITKFTKEGNLVFSTFFGGNEHVYGSKLKIDSENNIILTGIDGSNDFPTTPGAYQSENSGNNDIVLFKLDPAGGLVFSTYIGGSLSESPNSISTDNLGNIYVTGKTLSFDFPLKNAVFDTIQGKLDMFIVKFDKN